MKSSAAETLASNATASKPTSVGIDGYEPWRDKRAAILTKYTTNKKIPVQANFLEEEALQAPKAVQLTDEQIFQIVTRGQKNMPPYAAQIPAADRRAAVEYVRSLQGGAKP